MNEFVLKDNQLTQYALACGYLQQATDSGDKFDYTKKLELSKRHDTYEVFFMDYKTLVCEKAFYGSLTEARKSYKKLVKQYSLINLFNFKTLTNKGE